MKMNAVGGGGLTITHMLAININIVQYNDILQDRRLIIVIIFTWDAICSKIIFSLSMPNGYCFFSVQHFCHRHGQI